MHSDWKMFLLYQFCCVQYYIWFIHFPLLDDWLGRSYRILGGWADAKRHLWRSTCRSEPVGSYNFENTKMSASQARHVIKRNYSWFLGAADRVILENGLWSCRWRRYQEWGGMPKGKRETRKQLPACSKCFKVILFLCGRNGHSTE